MGLEGGFAARRGGRRADGSASRIVRTSMVVRLFGATMAVAVVSPVTKLENLGLPKGEEDGGGERRG